MAAEFEKSNGSRIEALHAGERSGRLQGYVFAARLLVAAFYLIIYLKWLHNGTLPDVRLMIGVGAASTVCLVGLESLSLRVTQGEKLDVLFGQLRDVGEAMDREISEIAQEWRSASGEAAAEAVVIARLARLSTHGDALLDTAETLERDPDMGAALARRLRGRPKGAGGFAAQDAPLVAKMREMILSTPGLTPFGAAGQFADKAVGTGEFEAKQRRLAAFYRKTHPD